MNFDIDRDIERILRDNRGRSDRSRIPDPERSAALRARLVGRAKRRQRSRPVVLLAALTAMVMATMVKVAPLEGRYDELRMVQNVDGVATFMPDTRSGDGLMYTRRVDGNIVPLTVSEAAMVARRQQVLREMHMAGLTWIDSVNGHTWADGLTELGVSYAAMVDSEVVRESMLLGALTVPPDEVLDRQIDYLNNRYRDNLKAALRGEVESLPDTTLFIDGRPIDMKRYPFPDPYFGTVIEWLDADYVARVSPKYRVPEEVEGS